MRKKLLASMLSLAMTAAVVPTSIMAEQEALTLKSFNATKKVIIVDFNNVNGGISQESLQGKISVTKRTADGKQEAVSDYSVDITDMLTGTDANGSESTTAEGNTIIITPSEGLDTESIYKVDIKAGVSDTAEAAASLSSDTSTGWFQVNEHFADDFTVEFEEDGITPKAPYYKNKDTDAGFRSSRWYASWNSGVPVTGINSAGVFRMGNGTAKAYVLMDSYVDSKLPEDYTVEYTAAMSGGGSHTPGPHCVALRNGELVSRKDPENYVTSKGYIFSIGDSAWNKNTHTVPITLKIDTNTYTVSEFDVKDRVFDIRASVVGNHLQYYVNNSKIFDLTDENNTYKTAGNIGFTAFGPHNNNSEYAYIDNVSVTSVTKLGEIDFTGISYKGFNATKSVITLDFNNVNGEINTDSLRENILITEKDMSGTEKAVTDYTLTSTKTQMGVNADNMSIEVAKGNSVIVTPAGGVDTDKIYKVDLLAGISDVMGVQMTANASTGWFMVNEIFSDDFNVAYEEDGVTPAYPYYKETESAANDNGAVKSRFWNASYRNEYTTISNGVNSTTELTKFQMRNNAQYMRLNTTGLPENKRVLDYTVEAELGLPKNYNKGSQSAYIRNQTDSNNGYRLAFVNGSYANKTADIGFYADSIKLGGINTYQLNDNNVKLRLSAIGDNIQYYIDNDKVYDGTDSSITRAGGVAFGGSTVYNQSPHTTVDNVSITTVILMGDIPESTEIVSYNADSDTVYLEVEAASDVNCIPEEVLNGIKLFDNAKAEVQTEVSVQDSYILIKPEGGVKANKKYTVKAEGLRLKYGTIINDYEQSFKLIESYAEDFSEGLGNWPAGTNGKDSPVVSTWNEAGQYMVLNKNSELQGDLPTRYVIPNNLYLEVPSVEYATEFDVIVNADSVPSLTFTSNNMGNKGAWDPVNNIEYIFTKSGNFKINGNKVNFYDSAKSDNFSLEEGTYRIKTVNKNGTGFVYVNGKLEAEFDYGTAYNAENELEKGKLSFWVGNVENLGIDNIKLTYVVDAADEPDVVIPDLAVTDAAMTAPTESGVVNVNITVQNNSFGGDTYTAVAALYDKDGGLVGVEAEVVKTNGVGSADEKQFTIENAAAASYAKVFLWDTLSGMKPVGEIKKIQTKTENTVYVNPSADLLSADGSFENPYTTIADAIDDVMEQVNNGATYQNFIVDVARGDCFIDDTVEINDRSGILEKSGSSITIKGQGSDKTSIKAGKTLDSAEFYKVEDEAILKRVPKSARDSIYAINLAGNGYINDKNTTLELAANGKIGVAARYPNLGEGYLTTGKVTDDYMSFAVSDELSQKWQNAGDMYIYYMPNYFSYNYSVSAENGFITTKNNAGFSAGKNYFVYNLLEELDSLGEYFYDKNTGVLYVYSENVKDTEYEIFDFKKNVISLSYCDNIKIKDLTIENSGSTLVDLNNVKNTKLENCVFKNGSKNAVNVLGYNSGILNCEIYDMGEGGISLSGGNRDVLSKGLNYVNHSSIHDCQRLDRSYKSLISMSGVGNYVVNSELYNSYHQVITIYGNDFIIKNNKFKNVCTETPDMGAIYAEGNWVYRGTVIDHNYFENIPANGSMGAFPIYLDNGLSGVTVKNNIFKDVTRQAVYINGGRDNTIENNIFVDSGNIGAISDILNWGNGYSYENPKPAGSKMINNLKAVGYTEEPYTKYKNLANILEDKPTLPKYNVFKNNVRVNAGGVSTGWLRNVTAAELEELCGCGIGSDETEFILSESDLSDYENGDYTLPRDKALDLGFSYIENIFGL